MSSGPPDQRVPSPGYFPDGVKELMIEATMPAYPDFTAEQREELWTLLRDWADAPTDQQLAALEDAGYRIVGPS